MLQHPQGGLREVDRHVRDVPSQQRELRIARDEDFRRDREQDDGRQYQRCRSRYAEAHRPHSSGMANDRAARGQYECDQAEPPQQERLAAQLQDDGQHGQRQAAHEPLNESAAKSIDR